MNPNECRLKLLELLDAQKDRILAANEYLVEIKSAIAENRLDNLNQFIADPKLPVDEIQQLEQQRFQLLASFGFASDRDGFEKCIAWCDSADQQLAASYQQLIEALLQLQHSIQLNNLLITKGKDRLRRSIGILTGLAATTGCKTYSSKGETLQSASQRNIAIA